MRSCEILVWKVANFTNPPNLYAKGTNTMSNYVQNVLADLIAKNPGEPEFHQAATEILESLEVIFDKHP